MTLDEFVEGLLATPRTWRLRRDGSIRCEGGDCPVIAVLCDGRQGRSNNLAFTVGRSVGLHDDIHAIVASADNIQHHRSFSHPLRARLLDACGLAGARVTNLE